MGASRPLREMRALIVRGGASPLPLPAVFRGEDKRLRVSGLICCGQVISSTAITATETH